MGRLDRIDAQMAFLILVWGSAFVGIRALSESLSPTQITWYRYAPFPLLYGATRGEDRWSVRLLWEGVGLDATAMMKREAPLFAWAAGQTDAREGVLSFLEKREPAWKPPAHADLPER